MKYVLAVFTLVFFSACKEPPSIEGYWHRDRSDWQQNYFFPYEIYCDSDSLFLLDSFLYEHRAAYHKKENLLQLSFTNKDTLDIAFEFISDSLLLLDGVKFNRRPVDTRYKSINYDLLGYRTSDTLDSKFNFDVIKLIQTENGCRFLVEDQIMSLEYLWEYLYTHEGPQMVALFIGKGVGFKDIIEAYFWIQKSGCNKVKLVTGNKTFESFYTLSDKIWIDEEIIKDFNITKSLPPHSTYDLRSFISQVNSEQLWYVYNTNDLAKFTELDKEKVAIVLVNENIDLQSYFKVLELLKDMPHKKMITRLSKNES